jgi:hypothetical protein
MKKLKLDVEDLAVQSFATNDAGGERGTVRAHNSWRVCWTGESHCYCTQPGTDWQTCENTCETCDGNTCETCEQTGVCVC